MWIGKKGNTAPYGTNRALEDGFSTLRMAFPLSFASQMMEQNFQQQHSVVSMSGANLLSDDRFVEAISPSMWAVEAVVRELAHSSVPVLLIGEHGAGKHTIARRIHQNSGWLHEHFHVKSCAGLTPEVLEADAFPAGATLYLDEIGDLSSECQKQLFELLSKHDMNGSARKGMRTIGGSSRDLETDVRAGAFQEDLYYLLSAVCLRIPPLRQRKEDVLHLMAFFLERYSEVFHRPVPRLSPPTQQLFVEYSWPGNLRELEAAARAIVAVGDESVVMGGLRSMLTRSGSKMNGEKTSLKEASRAASREAEKELILKVLTRTRWNRRRAAQELQISYKALLYKLKQIGYGEYGAT
jgi:two-component system, NtrC family, response regulator AtoC